MSYHDRQFKKMVKRNHEIRAFYIMLDLYGNGLYLDQPPTALTRAMNVTKPCRYRRLHLRKEYAIAKKARTSPQDTHASRSV